METGNPAIVRTPWDTLALGIETYELTELSENVFKSLAGMRGHFTAKIDPLASKHLLHQYGFYYCDTLIEPYCRREQFVFHHHQDIALRRDVPFAVLVTFVQGAFLTGRFHRDFNIERRHADERYKNWLKQLCEANNCFALVYKGETAGFFGFEQNKILLHALAPQLRGKGLAKFFWSAACRRLFGSGYAELQSSVSAANMPVLNLYASLGFRFRNPRDMYHLFQP